jgi:hypothetical protein
VLAKDQLLSKMSVLARFRHWLGGSAGKEPTALENEQLRSFSRALGSGGAGKGPTALENERNCSFSRVGMYICCCVIVVVVFPINRGVS